MAQLGVIWADGIWNTAIWNTAIWAQEAGPGDVTAPTVTSATINTAGTTITFALDESVVFGAGGNGGFTLSLSGGAVTATYSSGSGTTSLVYSLSRTVYSGETGTHSYTQPGNGVEDGAGNDLATYSGATVTNNSTASSDVTAPTLSSSTVASNGNSITLAFDESVSVGAGGNGGFTVSLSGGACTLTYSSGSGSSSLVYTTSRTIQSGETGTISYTQPGNGIEDAAGNDLATFTGSAITNNSTADTVAPAVTGATLIAATSLRFNFSEAVTFGAGGNAGWTVSLSGGAATLSYASGSGTNALVYTVSRSVAANETGTYAYTQPGNGVEDSAGNDLATITSTSLVNGIGGARNSARLHIWTGIGI